MKYLVLNVYNKEDYPQISEKGRQLNIEREKHPGKYPPHIFPPHTITGGLGEAKAIAIVEATEEQIQSSPDLNEARYVAYYNTFMATEEGQTVLFDMMATAWQFEEIPLLEAYRDLGFLKAAEI